jgi:hypothetical protein
MKRIAAVFFVFAAMVLLEYAGSVAEVEPPGPGVHRKPGYVWWMKRRAVVMGGVSLGLLFFAAYLDRKGLEERVEALENRVQEIEGPGAEQGSS